MKKIKDDHGVVVEELIQPISHTTANNIVKKWCENAELPSAKLYSGHSLRATFITIARNAGVLDSQIIRQTHHKNTDMLNTYDRAEQALSASPVFGFADAVA